MCLVEAKNLDELSRGTRICLGVALLTVVVTSSTCVVPGHSGCHSDWAYLVVVPA